MKTWYERAVADNEMTVEAGMKENILSSLLGALILMMSGASSADAAQRYRVDKRLVEQASNDKAMMERARRLKEQTELKENAEKWDRIQRMIESPAGQTGGTAPGHGKPPAAVGSPKAPAAAPSTKAVPPGFEKLKVKLDSMGKNDWDILTRVAEKHGIKGDARKLLYTMRIIENGRPGREMGQGDVKLTPKQARAMWNKSVKKPWINEITGKPFGATQLATHPARRYEGFHDRSLELQAEWAVGGIEKHFTGNLMDYAKQHCPEMASTPYNDPLRWFNNASHYM